MARMCNLIIAIIAGDVSDGTTEINRYINRRVMTKNEGFEVLDKTAKFECPDLITEKTHEFNIDFFEHLLKKICAGPPDGIHFHYIYKNFHDRVKRTFDKYYGVSSDVLGKDS
ncbi:hypothetical protein, partial [Cysteiniphilum marinum]